MSFEQFPAGDEDSHIEEVFEDTLELPLITNHQALEIDLTIGAVEHNLSSPDEEFIRRTEELGFRVASTREGLPVGRVTKFLRVILPGLTRKTEL